MANTWLDFPYILVVTFGLVLAIAIILRYVPPPSAERTLSDRIKQLSDKIDEQERKILQQTAIIENLTRQYRQALEDAAEANRVARVQSELIAQLRAEVADLRQSVGVKASEARLHILGVWPFPEIEINTTAEEHALYNGGFVYRSLREREASKEGLVLELRRYPYTLLEVDSHGTEEGIRLYDDIARPGWWVRLFNDYPSLQVMVLLACESDIVGDALVDAGVPVVISVQRALEDRHAVTFARNFYLYLARDFHTLASVEQAANFAKNLIPERSATLIRVRTNLTVVR